MLRPPYLVSSLVFVLIACGQEPTASPPPRPTTRDKTATHATEMAKEPTPPSPELHVLNGAELAGVGPNPVVLEWRETMTNFSVHANILIVRQDKTARFERIGAGATTQQLMLTDAEWNRTVADLVAHNVCDLRSSGEFEHEDQTPTLVVAVAGARCRVMLSDLEWIHKPHAKAVREAVTSLFPEAGRKTP